MNLELFFAGVFVGSAAMIFLLGTAAFYADRVLRREDKRPAAREDKRPAAREDAP